MSNNAKELIGRLCDSRFRYYDLKEEKYKFKLRPILIIGIEKEKLPCDLTVLPVSKISKKKNRDERYDFPLTKEQYSELNLKYNPSFVRTHKITTIYSNDLSFEYTDYPFSELYPEEYAKIKEINREFFDALF